MADSWRTRNQIRTLGNTRRSTVACGKLTGLVMPGTAHAEMNGKSGNSQPDQYDPSHHLAALSPHDDTNSNSNSPILSPAIALSSPTCPKPSFIRGPKSLMPKVEDVSIWLRSAVDPASALPPPAPCPPDTFPPPAPAPVSSSPSTAHRQPLHAVLPPLPSHARPERLSAAVMRPELVPMTQLYIKGTGDLALLVHGVVLFSFLHLVLSHTLFPMLARSWGYGRRGRCRGLGSSGMWLPILRWWGFGGCALTPSLNPQHTLSTTPASSALNPSTAHFWLDSRRPEFFSPLASGWNADAGSVQAPSRSPANSRFCASCLGLACCRFEPRAPDAHALLLWTGFLPRVFPDPNPMRVPIKKRFAGGFFGHAESDAGHRNVCALQVLRSRELDKGFITLIILEADKAESADVCHRSRAREDSRLEALYMQLLAAEHSGEEPNDGELEGSGDDYYP
ncbi:hypothetical protein B0H13DRAFT_2405382 [Mycena leptocephala]|nr:hypothetical protein B0H13DRAFT_2405382 [Mycena leptocephala]